VSFIADLPPLWPLMLALVAAGALGLRRGWVRELATLGLILLTWLLVFGIGLSIVEALNKLALMAAFTWQGGFDSADPAGLLRTLRLSPAIDLWRPEWFYALLFALGVVGAYMLGGRMAARSHSAFDAILGGLAGAVNGYAVAYVVLGYLQVSGQTTAGVAAASSLLGGYATTVVVAVVIGAVGIAMLTSLRGTGAKARG
jgi:hypothetical protein